MFEITGVLATSDPKGRLRLCLVDYLEMTKRADYSWKTLKKEVPAFSAGGHPPYTFLTDGTPDDAGIRGECWITISGRDKKRRDRILALAVELRSKEVVCTVTPRRYSFAAREDPQKQVTGVALQLNFLEKLQPRPPHAIKRQTA